jgi:MFS family permease
MAGSSAAFFLQGSASFLPKEAQYPALFVGKALGGLFGGTFPIMLCYIADFTAPDFLLLKKRTIGLVMCMMGAPIVFVPIGGALGRISLALPFIVTGAMGLVGLIVAYLWMKEGREIKAAMMQDPLLHPVAHEPKQIEKIADNRKDVATSNDKKPLHNTGSVWTDPALLYLGTAFMFVVG